MRRNLRLVRRPAGLLLLWGLLMTLAACSGDGSSSRERGEDPSSARGREVATDLRAKAACIGDHPNNHAAEFSWRPAEPPGDQQQLVLSYLAGGLDTDAFVRSPPLAPDASTYQWVHLNPGEQPRYWRVLTRRGDEWVASETATFDDLPCPG